MRILAIVLSLINVFFGVGAARTGPKIDAEDLADMGPPQATMDFKSRVASRVEAAMQYFLIVFYALSAALLFAYATTSN